MSFEFASTSVTGTMHRDKNKQVNGQDASVLGPQINTTFGTARVLLVVDGCGSGAHSEVGAIIGARLLMQSVHRQLQRWHKTEEAPRIQFVQILERARQDLLARLRILTQEMGGSYSQTINDHFLFTVVGAVITQEYSCFFSRGDGLIVINDEEHWIEPDKGNEPAYLAYGLVETRLTHQRPNALQFEICRVVETPHLDHFLIGTDGMRHFVDASHLPLPGMTEPVGPLSQFWELDRYFSNSDNARRQLARTNRPTTVPDWEGRRLVTYPGHLKDDTTFIVGRRVRCAN